jgi:hypothetical protein
MTVSRAVRRLGVGLVTLGLLAGCAHRSAEPSGAAERPSVGMSFGQLPIQVGTDKGLLRLVNTGKDDLPVTRIGLDWSGYGRVFLASEDNVLAPGQMVDFPVRLPRPDCTASGGNVRGIVDAGDATVSAGLDRAGATLLRRTHAQVCAEEYVRARVDVAYGGCWRTTGTGRATAAVGHLRLTRKSGDDEIRLVAVQGSVLYDLALPGPSVLPSGVGSAEVPLRVTPGNRCDEHALSQASAPFAFRLTVSVGGRRAGIGLVPPPDVQTRLPELLRRACG